MQRWRHLIRIGALTIALLLAPALIWGWDRQIMLFETWQHCLSRQTPEFLTTRLNQNFAATLSRFSGHLNWMPALSYAFVIIAAIGAFYLSRKLKTIPAQNDGARARILCVVLASYLVLTPLSWRWLSFLWIPLGFLLGVDSWRGLRSRMSTRALRTLTLLFAINGVLLQTVVAHAIGIREVDELSAAGLYCWGNLLLFGASLLSLWSTAASSRRI